MNTVDELVQSLNPGIIQNLKRAVELGKFPDGRAVSCNQKELMLEAILLYENEHTEETQRTGYIDSSKNKASVSSRDLIATQKIPHE